MENQAKTEKEENEVEIIKAVAQAWHGHSNNSSTKSMDEVDAYKRNFMCRPTRFKQEAINKAYPGANGRWDFGQSLWDSYEILDVSNKLERGLVLDYSFDDEYNRALKKRKESKNSLRRMLSRSFSGRFNPFNIPKG